MDKYLQCAEELIKKNTKYIRAMLRYIWKKHIRTTSRFLGLSCSLFVHALRISTQFLQISGSLCPKRYSQGTHGEGCFIDLVTTCTANRCICMRNSFCEKSAIINMKTCGGTIIVMLFFSGRRLGHKVRKTNSVK
jgi:hypothetical protein